MKQTLTGMVLLLALAVILPAPLHAASLPEFTGLVKELSPTVVNITTRRRARSALPREEMPEMLRRFFEAPPRQGPAAASGFIISEDGYIVTNFHVIDGAEEIVVALADRRERVAEVVGTDKLSDLAVLKIEADDLPTVRFGSSDALAVGEWVLAIGSPFGFEHSVTVGIVSAKGRSLPEGNGNYVPYIQTDVAINPGNSGGPLFDLEGRVVGINSQIVTRSGGFMGLSFAIPGDVAQEVIAQLKDTGRVDRGWLGVLIQRVDRDLAESFGLDRPSGALVTQVFPDSPAAQGGVREGDIITEFNGHKIDLSSDLPHVVGRTLAETEVELVVVRNGKKRRLDVQVGTLDEEDLAAAPGFSPSWDTTNRLNVGAKDIPRGRLEELGVKGGVLVERVGPGAAREAGIETGDVITMINNEWIDSLADFEARVEALPAERALPVRVVRRGRPVFLVIKIED